MIENLIKSIGIALHNEFGDNVKIYPEKVEQGLKTPCFFITCLNPSKELFLGRRYFCNNQFCIQYVPANPHKEKQECNNVLERLFSCLEWIKAMEDDKPIHGNKMRGETVNGVLNFFVNYDCFVNKQADETVMMGGLTYTLNERK